MQYGTRILLTLIAALALAPMSAWANPSDSTAAGYPRLQSVYVPMRDGVNIAVDVWLPETIRPKEQVPTIIEATRYWRALDLVYGTLERDRNYEKASRANAMGYAMAFVDARGSGASEGTRPYEMTVEEINDYAEVIDWIVSQPWSSGKVATFGISYSGNTAEVIPATQHPAVAAAAPIFQDFNWIEYLIMPGGVKLDFFLEDWGELIAALDRNDICAAEDLEPVQCSRVKQFVRGVKPVDGDPFGIFLERAIDQHAMNIKVHEAMDDWDFHDDPMGPLGITDAYSRANPSGYTDLLEAAGTPLFVRVGWLDAATTNGALSRYNTVSNPQHVIIGPWSHGGRHDTDPFNPPNEPVYPPLEMQVFEMVTFFNRYMKRDEPRPIESSIKYYTLGSGEWNTTETWPPDGYDDVTWYFQNDGALNTTAPNTKVGSDHYTIDFTATTGMDNRWRTNAGGYDVVYPDRRHEDEKLLTYTSAPLERDTVVTGTPVVTLHVRSTHEDGAFFVYLEDVAPDGRVTYVTEGQLRGVCRALAEEEPAFAKFGPHRTFLRDDAKPLVPGEVAELRFELWATSVEFKQGHRIRVAIAGADKDNFARYPEEGAPAITVERNAVYPSHIVLPTEQNSLLAAD